MPIDLTIKDNSPAGLPSISICVPVYNVESYLKACLDSLLGQDYPNFEIVLVDDGSTDSSGVICDEYAAKHPNSVVVAHRPNEGPLLARRKGFSLAKGDYVMCVDSDDMLLPGAVTVVANAIEKTKADVILFRATRSSNWSKCSYFSTKNGMRCILTSAGEKVTFLKRICQSTDGSQNPMWLKAVRKSCIGAEIDLTAFSGLTFAEDFLQTIIIYDRSSTFAELDATLYYYRLGSGITRSYAPHMYEDVCRALDFADGYARRWESEYGCDGLLAGLAACRLDSAAQLAEYLADRHDRASLESLRSSADFRRCRGFSVASAYLTPRRRVTLFALDHGLYPVLRIPSVIRCALGKNKGVPDEL